MRVPFHSLVFPVTLSVALSCFVLSRPATAEEGKVVKQDKPEFKTVDVKQTAGRVFTFHQSGGFVPTNLKYEQSLTEMKAEERKELEQLIDKSGLLNVQSDRRITKGACDMFVYSFSLKDGAKEHQITFDDGTLPDSYRALVTFAKLRMSSR